LGVMGGDIMTGPYQNSGRWAMEQKEILARAKTALGEAFGSRLRQVILYGSEARDQAAPDSDIDLLVLLAGPIDLAEDLHACIHALYPLVLETARPIDVLPVDEQVFRAQQFSLYRTVAAEGVTA
jgi:uncharacterized protein